MGQVLREPCGYPEDTQVEKEEETAEDQEREENGGSQKGERATYESHVARHMDVRKRKSQ